LSSFGPDVQCPDTGVPFTSTVLNLPTSASHNEIRERYRSLSMIFHPDKQHGDANKKEIAAKRFLEIQKAYEGMFSLM